MRSVIVSLGKTTVAVNIQGGGLQSASIAARAAQEAIDAAAAAKEYAERAEQATNIGIVDAFLDIAARRFPDQTNFLEVRGYYAAGDSRPFHMEQVGSPPPFGGAASADGKWWARVTWDDHEVRQFGAKGDWNDITKTGTDDTAAARTYLAWVRSVGGGNPWFTRGKYLLTQNIAPSGIINDMVLVGDGPGETELIHQRTNGVLVAWAGNRGANIALTAPAAMQSYTLDLADTSSLAAGDSLYLFDPDLIPIDHTDNSAICIMGELVRVRTVVSPTQILTWGALEMAHGTNAYVAKLNLCRNTGMRDLTIRNPTPGSVGLAGRGAQFFYTKDLILDNVQFVGMDDNGVRIDFAVDATFTKCHFQDLSKDTSEFGGQGYGINISQGCWGVLVGECTAEKARHLVTTTGGVGNPEPAHVMVYDSMGRECYGAPFDTHPAGRYITFDNCHAYTGIENPIILAPGFQIRTRKSKVINPTVVNAGIGVYFVGGEDGTLEGGTFDNVQEYVRIRSSFRTRARGSIVTKAINKVVRVEKDGTLSAMPGVEISDLTVDGNVTTSRLDFNHWQDDYLLSGIYTPDITVADVNVPHWALYGGTMIDSFVKFENVPRNQVEVGSINPLTSGELLLVGLNIPKGERISRIAFCGATGPTAQTNQWSALYDRNLNLLGVTADDGASGTGGFRQRSLTTPITTEYDGLYYVGLVSVATAPQQYRGQAGAAAILGVAPILNGRSTTGLTDPASAPATAAALTAIGLMPWVGVG